MSKPISRIFAVVMSLCTGFCIANPDAPLGFDAARHLLSRTQFAASLEEVEAFAKASPNSAAAFLLDGVVTEAATPLPAWAARYERVYKPTMNQEERQQATRREMVERGLDLRVWWMSEMMSTRSQFTEKMVLFWHNHFATGQEKVRSAYLMARQNQIIRKHAMGNFGDLLREVVKDPAMLIYLDQAQSRKGTPNENLARELMELFTLGEGNYSERDIKEVARALTGWSTDADTGAHVWRQGAHDPGDKEVFGQRGKFNGDDVLKLLLGRPETSQFIVTKLWREFVSPNIDSLEVARLAKVLRESNYALRPLMSALLTSPGFYHPESRAALVKSPVELVVGTLRQFNVHTDDMAPFVVPTRQLGQAIFQPPNVKGWPGGDAWINSATLLARKSFVDRVLRENEMGMPASFVDMAGESGRNRQIARLAMKPEQRGGLKGQYYLNSHEFLKPFKSEEGGYKLYATVLPTEPVQVQSVDYSLAGLRALALDPVYQLK